MQSQEEIVYLDPVVMETPTPFNEIFNIATNFSVDAKFIDFSIVEIFTEYKLVGAASSQIVDSSKSAMFDDDTFFTKHLESIRQYYKVEFFDIRKNKPKPLPKISISVNKNLTKIIAVISRSSEVGYFSEFEKKITDYINKKLIRAGVLIGIRNKNMKAELSKISSILRINEVLDKNYTFLVTTGVDQVEPVDDGIVLHYKNKVKNADENGKIDYASRGYILGVAKDELIIEYIRPVSGKQGRNVRGELLDVAKPKTTITKMIEHSPNIRSSEDSAGIKYFANKSGYVSDEKNVFDIKDQIDVNEISFKTTGSIETGLDNNVVLNVKEKDVTKDAIGSGVYVEATHINIDGNVAQNAVIKANSVVIGGQTHAKSRIEAKEAKIGVHIGTFDGDHVEIDRLENGKVKAKTAVIKSILGGEVVADKLQVDVLVSNANITVADTIEIKKLKGTNNKITVDFGMVKDFGDKIDENMKKIKIIKDQISKMPKILESKKSIIEENRAPINIIKDKMEEFSKNDKTPPVTFIKKIKEYQQLVHEYNELLKEFDEKNSQISELKEEIQTIQNGIFNSKVINHSNWREFNEIKFKLIDPPREILYNTRENEIARVLTIKKVESENGDVDYVVKKSSSLKS